MKQPTNQNVFVILREVVVDSAIHSFFGTYGVYYWLGTKDAKTTVVDAFGIEFFAVTRAVILLVAMSCMIVGGYRLIKILWRFKGAVKFVPPELNTSQQKTNDDNE